VPLDQEAAPPQAAVELGPVAHRPRSPAAATANAAGGPAPRPRHHDDALGSRLQRAVEQRSKIDLAVPRASTKPSTHAVLARLLDPGEPQKADNAYIGEHVVRHQPLENDEKLVKVTGVTRNGQQKITHFQVQRAPNSADSDAVAITDVGYGWAPQRKASRKLWSKSQQPAQAQQVVQPQQPAQGQPAALTVRAGNTLTAPKTMPQQDADRRLTLPAGAPPITDTDTVWTLDARDIRYTQDSIDYKYSKPTPGGARNVNEAVTTLLAGEDTFGAMPTLRVVLTHRGLIRTLDNRRVWVSRRAWTAGDPPVRWARKQEYLSEASKWTGEGKSITVRNVPGGVKLKQPPPRQ
jgi:hypothetical protein